MRAVHPEAAVLKACLFYLNTIPGCRAWRQNTGAVRFGEGLARRFVRFGVKGQPDITGLINHVRLDVEVKAPGNKPTIDQAVFMEELAAFGGVVFWCSSVEECSRLLREEHVKRGWEWRESWSITSRRGGFDWHIEVS